MDNRNGFFIYTKYHIHQKIDLPMNKLDTLKTMSKLKISGYVCCHCSREYKEKFNYDRHIQCCEFLNKPRREQENEIDAYEKTPTPKEMFRLIQELSLRINKLERENAELKQYHRKKMNIMDWLNKNRKPNVTLEAWKESIFNNIKDNLETVYKNDLLTGIIEVLNSTINNEEVMPICAFDIKQNTLYTFDNEKNTWEILEHSEFDKLIGRISHNFLVEFNRCWCMVHKERIERDDTYKELYIEYYKKILGGDRLTNESRSNRIRQAFYMKLKRTVKNMIDVE
jgi:hypothetical protein